MTIEFITARRGAAHVDSDDVRALNRETIGPGSYILSGCECAVRTANSVNVAAGELMIDGGHIRITGQGETVAIDNGSTSYKRNDLICLHYQRLLDGIESIEVVAVKGTPTDSDPRDPAMPVNGSIAAGDSEAYYPMYRIPLDGLTVGDPVLLMSEKTDREYDLQLMMGIYEGRNLADLFAGEIAAYSSEAEWFNARIIAGDFTGIRIFDYFDITLTDNKVFRYRVAAIDPYLYCIDQETTKHHIIMVPDQVWPDLVVWNTTNTNQGTASERHPYLASNLHRWEINTFYALLPAKWKNVIATHRMLLEERYSASNGSLTAATSLSWADVGKVFSLSETEVYGQEVWGTKGYSVAADCHFDVFFKHTKNRIRRDHAESRRSWWLRTPAGMGATHACNVHETGQANSNGAAASWGRALPCFRVGV